MHKFGCHVIFKAATLLYIWMMYLCVIFVVHIDVVYVHDILYMQICMV